MRTIVRETLLVGADARGEVGHRRLVSSSRRRAARRVELAAMAADAARPGVFPQRVDHRAARCARASLELDAAIFVAAVGGVDQPRTPSG
jgi:hypothetical protein